MGCLVRVLVFPSACPCTYPLTCLHLYKWAFIFAGPFQTFQNLAYSCTTYLYKMGLLCLHIFLFFLSSHISLLKQCLTDRTSPKKYKVFLCMSFIFLEFWNHVDTTVQGLSYITITAGAPTRWKLKEYGCRQLRLMHGTMVQEVGQTYFVPRDPRKRGDSSLSLKI